MKKNISRIRVSLILMVAALPVLSLFGSELQLTSQDTLDTHGLTVLLFDAGDYDLRTQTQTRVITDLTLAKEVFGDTGDETTVDEAARPYRSTSLTASRIFLSRFNTA